jgi:virulence-associated protein VapD
MQFGVVFDLDTNRLQYEWNLYNANVGWRNAYTRIRTTLEQLGWVHQQGSGTKIMSNVVYFSANNADLQEIVFLVDELRLLPWLHASVRDIRVFEVRGITDIAGLI